jgi:uncharacterized membrane protein YhaH (DUF805 family)
MNSVFISTFIDVFRKTFEYDGRTSKAEFLCMGFICLNGMAIFYKLLPALYPNPTFELISIFLFNICIFFPSLSISVRRLHDLDYSGWFVLIAFIPIVNLILQLFLLFKRGNKDINKYGPATIDRNLTSFDKVWLWTFIAIAIFELGRRLHLTYQLFNQ